MIIKKILSKTANLLFPGRCTICDKVIGTDRGICSMCEPMVQTLSGDVCMRCGKRINDGKVYCYDCMRRSHEFERNFSVFAYPVIKDSLYRFKYQGRAEYAAYYAKQAVLLHGRRLEELNADALVPIPLHRFRQRKRGYNQSEELAKELSKRICVPVENGLIKRIKSTKALKTLDIWERQNNLKRAFLIMQNDVKLKTIILVDDIYTTGATIDAAAQVCKAAGIEKVYSLTVAVGNGI